MHNKVFPSPLEISDYLNAFLGLKASCISLLAVFFNRV